MGFALFGRRACQALGFNFLSAEFWAELERKRWSVVLGAWFIGNTLINNLVSTGAFEITYGTDVVFSRLSTGRMPSMEEILLGVQEALHAGN
jgi:hypothetical protein